MKEFTKEENDRMIEALKKILDVVDYILEMEEEK